MGSSFLVRSLQIEIDKSTWQKKIIHPRLRSASGRVDIDLGEALHELGTITMPSILSPASPALFWAWLRYYLAPSKHADLRLTMDFSDLDPHQKGILSDDFGVALATHWARIRLGPFTQVVDGRKFANQFRQLQRKQHKSKAKVGTSIIALEPLDKGLMRTLLRYPYEVRDPQEYFDDIQDVKVTKDMLDLARHIVDQKSGSFEPDKFEDQYETALVDLINQKRSGKPITPKERPRGENVVDLMDALRKSVGSPAAGPKPEKESAKKPRKAAAGQKEMLMPIAGKKPAKETAAKKPAARSQRKSA
jgi:hypothetical protein